MFSLCQKKSVTSLFCCIYFPQWIKSIIYNMYRKLVCSLLTLLFIMTLYLSNDLNHELLESLLYAASRRGWGKMIVLLQPPVICIVHSVIVMLTRREYPASLLASALLLPDNVQSSSLLHLTFLLLHSPVTPLLLLLKYSPNMTLTLVPFTAFKHLLHK